MHPPSETFVELETALSKILTQRWKAALQAGWPAIKASWDAGKYETAIELVGAIQVGPFHQAQERRIRAIGTAMLAHGAQHVSKKAGAKRLSASADATPLDQALVQLAAMAEQDTPAFAVRMLQAEARRQLLTAPDAPEESLEGIFAKADGDGDLGPSSYRARNVILSGGKWSSDLSANLTTSRLVNYGSLDAMREGGVTRYRLKVTVDERTSNICMHMRNREFDVGEGFSLLQRALTATDPADLRVIQPWVPWAAIKDLPDMSNDELRARNWFMPPFHPRCRTIAVPVGRMSRRASQTRRGLQPHPLHDRTVLNTDTSLPLADLVDGGGVMRVVRTVGPQTPLYSWELDALGDLIEMSLGQQAVAGRLTLAQAEEIVSGLVRTAIPNGPAQTAMLDALLDVIKGQVGNETGWMAARR